MKRFIITTLSLSMLLCLTASAQRTLSEIAQSTTFGGYGIASYINSGSASKNSGMNMRMFRAYANGKMFDNITYRLQMEVSGAPGVDKGPRIVDAYLQWQPKKWLGVRVGQQKRAITFENPTHPYEVYFGSFSQVVTKLCGMNDRVGEHASGGRDIGVTLIGDFDFGADRTLLHYQGGFYTGQGINHSEVAAATNGANRHKDVIGGFWVNPTKDLNIGAWGWSGKYYNAATTQTYLRDRLAYGIRYENRWIARAEYMSSVGEAPGKGNRADGWYALLGRKLCNDKVQLLGKWDVYRDEKSHDSQNTMWCATAEYWANKNLKLQANYYYTEAGKLVNTDKHHYHTADIQLYFRF